MATQKTSSTPKSWRRRRTRDVVMDLYSVLGVSRSASADEIERAYRRLARRYHPGINPGDRLAKERFRQVDVAYRVLADADQRREYDRRGAIPAVVAQVDAALSFEGF